MPQFFPSFQPVLSRFLAFAVATTLMVAARPSNGQEAEKPTKAVEKKVLVAKDGWPIHITYYRSDKGKETPVVVLLHDEGGNRLVWDVEGGFASRLHDLGYAVITVDLRHHGESKMEKAAGGRRRGRNRLTKADYLAMLTMDLVAVKKFIWQEHNETAKSPTANLNMRKMAIVAPGFSAPIAINFTSADWLRRPYDDGVKTPRGQDVRALILLSPEDSLAGLPTGKTITALREPAWGIATLMFVGAKDKFDRGKTKRLFSKIDSINKAGEQCAYFYELDNVGLRGTALIGKNLNVELRMLAFLKKHLQDLNGPADQWRNRVSPLFR